MLVKVSCDDLFDLFPTYPFFLHCICLSLPSAYVVKLICISVFTRISIHTIPLRSTRLYGPVRACVRACTHIIRVFNDALEVGEDGQRLEVRVHHRRVALLDALEPLALRRLRLAVGTLPPGGNELFC